jgi:hypothetical protein
MIPFHHNKTECQGSRNSHILYLFQILMSDSISKESEQVIEMIILGLLERISSINRGNFIYENWPNQFQLNTSNL